MESVKMPELVEQIEKCYKNDVEDSVKCGLFVLADAVDGNKNAIKELNKKVDGLDSRIMDRFIIYDKIFASHSSGFKDLRKFIIDEVITRLDKNSGM